MSGPKMIGATFTLACTCGAYIRGQMPLEAWETIARHWIEVHSGEGHARCTPRQAARARYQREARELGRK